MLYGITNIIEDSRRTNISLPNGRNLHIKNALYFSKSYRNLLHFEDICLNGYHIETINEGYVEYPYITKLHLNKKESI
uniref:Uncharacterized protein n=1 Tax=Cajanus cajan TaxID=3821 RepID=A0A151R0C7_CAJCA|nr:hypothetical protein KK1_042864 [Cajanus cajan]KYP36041.1 hypothetical protein KK1_042865 [Cajanus cajan]KYP36042.1 hypothetical protein KK1_042866 [Cajanus cajan]